MLEPPRQLNVLFHVMRHCRILYFQGGILEATEELASADLIDAAKAASSRHPHMTAEIWLDGTKAAIVRPSWAHPSGYR